MRAVELLKVLAPIFQRKKPGSLPSGAICLGCKELGPNLVVSDLVPNDVIVGVQFVCGKCGREWEWSYSDGVYSFIREVQPEI